MKEPKKRNITENSKHNSKELSSDSKSANIPSMPLRTEEEKKKPKLSEAIYNRLKFRWLLEEEAPENDYYIHLSEKIRILKLFSVILLVIFTLTMLSVWREDLTVENARYFFRDLQKDSAKFNGEYSSINYEKQTNASFGIFKGDIVLVKSGETSIYSTVGSQVMKEINSFYQPVLLSSEKYFLVYDIGDTSYTYSVYNAYSELNSGTMSGPITSAALADNGTYCLATSDNDYKGVLEIYDNRFRLLSRISKEKYIMDVAISKNGDRVLLLSSSCVDGKWESEAQLIDPYAETPLQTIRIEDSLPLSVVFTEEAGGFCILTDSGLLYGKEGNAQLFEADFNGEMPIYKAMDSKYQVVFFEKNILGSEKTICVYNYDGNQIGLYSVTGDITDCSISGDSLCVAMEEKVFIFNIITGETETKIYSEHLTSLLSLEDNRILTCFTNHAEVVSLWDNSVSETEIQ